MKICIICDNWSVNARRWIEWLAKKYEVFTITAAPDKNVKVRQYVLRYGLPCSRSTYRFAFSPLTILQVRRILKKEKPDVTLAVFIAHYGVLGAFAGAKNLILSVRGTDVSYAALKYLPISWAVRYAIKKAKFIHCKDKCYISKVKALGAKDSQIISVPEGIDVSLFSPEKRNGHWHRENGLGRDLTLLCLRKLHPTYNPELLIRAFALAVKELPSLKLVMLREGSLQNEILELISKLKLGKNIKFINSWLPYEAVPKVLASADIFVDPFHDIVAGGGIAKSNLEAMCSGLPIIVADTEEVGAYVQNGKTGLIYKKGDAEDFAKKILGVAKDKKLREKLGKNAREFILKNFDWAKNVAQMDAILKGLVLV